MSDCSTHAFEYPGMSRLIIRWTDPHERVHNWPFVSNGREVASVEVDGIEYVDAEKLKATNGELCAQVNELEKRIAELEAGRTCFNASTNNYFQCSACGVSTYRGEDVFAFCPRCGAKVVSK